MAQWPFNLTSVRSKPTLPMALPIPEEWHKANEALQAVQQTKSSGMESLQMQEEQGPVNNFTNSFGWPNANMYTTYPGFPNYPPNYGFYNYNFNYMMGNNPYFVNPISASNQPSVSLPSVSLPKINESDSKAGKSSSENISMSALACQPPPPPPTSPPSPSRENNGFFNCIASKQAPGSVGIKFNLPKKKVPNKSAFQSNQENLQARISDFRNFNETTPGHREGNEDCLLQQKSVSTLSTEKWPPSLRKYVDNCFKKCKNNLDKDQVEIILKDTLLRAYKDQTIFTKDWDSEPFPSIHSERLEQEQKLPPVIRNQPPKSNLPSSKNNFQRRNRSFTYCSRSRSRSRSYSRSRSRSRTPPRRVLRRQKHSSSSESSDDSRGSRKTLSSSVISPSEFRGYKNNNSKNKKKKKYGKVPFTVDSEFTTDERLLKRAARFDVKQPGRNRKPNNLVFTISNPFVIDETGADIEWGSDAITGTCQEMEKPFLRLTGAVDPASVRPVEVLMKSLSMVQAHWFENQDYHYACEQLKSIRQDLVVQCIRNSFTVQVYETHARIALEKGDHTEFNQCQSQLKALYQEVNEGNRLEFTGYHILYTIYTENTIEMKDILADLSPEDKMDEVVYHALKLSKAWSSSNYHRFFRLYISAPKMSSYIIDWFIEKIRKAALKAIIKSFRPNLPVSHIQSALAFPSTEECMAFLTKAGLIFVDADVINCKESMGPLANF